MADAIRSIGVTEVSHDRWRREFGGLKSDCSIEAALDNGAARAAMIDTPYQRLADCLAERRTTEWLALLAQADMPCSTVNSIEDLFDDPRLRAAGFFETVVHPSEGPLIAIKPAVRFSGPPARTASRRPPGNWNEGPKRQRRTSPCRTSGVHQMPNIVAPRRFITT